MTLNMNSRDTTSKRIFSSQHLQGLLLLESIQLRLIGQPASGYHLVISIHHYCTQLPEKAVGNLQLDSTMNKAWLKLINRYQVGSRLCRTYSYFFTSKNSTTKYRRVFSRSKVSTRTISTFSTISQLINCSFRHLLRIRSEQISRWLHSTNSWIRRIVLPEGSIKSQNSRIH